LAYTFDEKVHDVEELGKLAACFSSAAFLLYYRISTSVATPGELGDEPTNAYGV